MASRFVLARIEAAEIEGSLPSPPMIAFASISSLGVALPSISAKSGETGSPATARCIAKKVASRIFRESISSTEAFAMLQYFALLLISVAKKSRRFSLSFLESAKPSMGLSPSRMTQAAVTGPAHGPRPASSIPQIRSKLPMLTILTLEGGGLK